MYDRFSTWGFRILAFSRHCTLRFDRDIQLFVIYWPSEIVKRKQNGLWLCGWFGCSALTCLAVPCLALPCLALHCIALPCIALPRFACVTIVVQAIFPCGMGHLVAMPDIVCLLQHGRLYPSSRSSCRCRPRGSVTIAFAPNAKVQAKAKAKAKAKARGRAQPTTFAQRLLNKIITTRRKQEAAENPIEVASSASSSSSTVHSNSGL